MAEMKKSKTTTLSNGVITVEGGGHKKVDYYNYIDTNPLYLHNHKIYYQKTVNKIRSKGYGLNEARTSGKAYLDYLKSREQNILNRIGGQKMLNLIMKESFIDNEKIKQVLDLLREAFGRNSGYRVAVTGKKVKVTENNPRGIENVFHIQKIDTKEKISVALEYAGKKEGGMTKYNYEKAINDIKEEGKNFINDMGMTIFNAFKTENGFLKEINNLIEDEVLDSSKKAPGMLDFLRIIGKNKTTAEVLLELIIASLGPFNTYSGIYPEAIKTVYTDSVIALAEAGFVEQSKNLKMERNKKLLNTVNKDGQQILKWIDKLSKTDMYIKYDLNLDNPITISRKVTSSMDTKNFKLQSDITLDNLYEAFAKENIKIAKVYKYLVINNAFYSTWDGFDSNVFNRIIRYMSYVFLSGGTNLGNTGSLSNLEFNTEKALYFVYTKPGPNEGIITRFIPMSAIIDKLINGNKSNNSGNLDRAVTITRTKRSIDDISELWEVKKIIKEERKKWSYEFLSKDGQVENKAKEIVKNILESHRKAEIKIDFLDYLVKTNKQYGNLF